MNYNVFVNVHSCQCNNVFHCINVLLCKQTACSAWMGHWRFPPEVLYRNTFYVFVLILLGRLDCHTDMRTDSATENSKRPCEIHTYLNYILKKWVDYDMTLHVRHWLNGRSQWASDNLAVANITLACRRRVHFWRVMPTDTQDISFADIYCSVFASLSS